MIQLIDSSAPSVTYFGQAVSGSYTVAGKSQAIWKIWVLDSSGNKLFAEGDHRNFNVWDDRAGYDYK